MRSTFLILSLALFPLTTFSDQHQYDRDRDHAKAFAVTQLQPKSGSSATGTVLFFEDGDNLRAKAWVKNVSAGAHGIHIHEKGDCSARDASSAGGHFNPTGEEHGEPVTAPHHAGDLGNIYVGENGKGTLEVTLRSSDTQGFDNWNQIIGKAVVLHLNRDDFTTQPAGDSGTRIACGVIELAKPTTSKEQRSAQ